MYKRRLKQSKRMETEDYRNKQHSSFTFSKPAILLIAFL